MKRVFRQTCLPDNGARVGERLCWLLSGLLLLAAIGVCSSWRWSSTSTATASALQVRQLNQTADRLHTKSIEAIRPGDRVLARDPAAGTTQIKAVVATYRRTTDHLRIVGIQSANGETQELRTTDEHPFWVAGVGWVDAGQLRLGQSLCQQDDSFARVVTTRREEHPDGIPVFNLQTEDYHTYYAAQNPYAPAVLVHNACEGKANADNRLPNVNKAVNSGIQHAGDQAVAKEIVARSERTVVINELKELSKTITKDGFPAGTVPDPGNVIARNDSVLVPYRGGAAVYEVGKNGTARLMTLLNAEEFAIALQKLGLRQ